jgi:hypothetical protein
MWNHKSNFANNALIGEVEDVCNAEEKNLIRLNPELVSSLDSSNGKHEFFTCELYS